MMKKLIAITILVAGMFSPALLQAADDKPVDAPKTEKKAPGLPFNGKVSAVDKTAKTITLGETEKARTFQITSETKIFKSKKPATFDDVAVGDQVGGYARKNAEGKSEVVTLNTGLPAKGTKAKPAEKKPADTPAPN